jgi:hypothetical protein
LTFNKAAKVVYTDAGFVEVSRAPKELADAILNARLTKDGYFDERTKSGKAAVKARAAIADMVMDAWHNEDEAKLMQFGIYYY